MPTKHRRPPVPADVFVSGNGNGNGNDNDNGSGNGNDNGNVAHRTVAPNAASLPRQRVDGGGLGFIRFYGLTFVIVLCSIPVLQPKFRRQYFGRVPLDASFEAPKDRGVIDVDGDGGGDKGGHDDVIDAAIAGGHTSVRDQIWSSKYLSMLSVTRSVSEYASAADATAAADDAAAPDDAADIAAASGASTYDLTYDDTGRAKHKRAIFMIALGTADASDEDERQRRTDTMLSLVERCVLSVRRRGEWRGPVALLTDIPVHLFQGNNTKLEGEGNRVVKGGHLDQQGGQNGGNDNLLLILPPRKEHYSRRATFDLRYKRFKTYILDYVDSDSRLSSVELVYYFDIDIMAGASLEEGLFKPLEQRYMSRGANTAGAWAHYYNEGQQLLPPNFRSPLKTDRPSPADTELPRMYFFHGRSKYWPIQGGQFILERGGPSAPSSGGCLKSWRERIDNLRKFKTKDQTALKDLLKMLRLANDDDQAWCRVVIMKQKPFISFPETGGDLVALAGAASFPERGGDLVALAGSAIGADGTESKGEGSLTPLIHLLNSHYAKTIDEETQTAFVENVLRMEKGEIGRGAKWAMNVMPPSKSVLKHWEKQSNRRVIFLLATGDGGGGREKGMNRTDTLPLSHVVRRCILSIRRRGAFHGYIVVLTDDKQTVGALVFPPPAPGTDSSSVYEKVIVATPPPPSPNVTEDATRAKLPLSVLNHVGSDPRLASSELIYVLDVRDVFVNAPLQRHLFSPLEGKYGVLRQNSSKSAVYFFSAPPPSSNRTRDKAYPLQTGQFVVERTASGYCFDLWKKLVNKFETRARSGLFELHKRFEREKKSKCRVILMEHEDLISFPTKRSPMEDEKGEGSEGAEINNQTALINLHYMEGIGEESRNAYVEHVLDLSAEDKADIARVSDLSPNETAYVERLFDPTAKKRVVSNTTRRSKHAGLVSTNITTPPTDPARAIFLIAFGRQAVESTLVERSVMSIRRRGHWDGYVVLLTDAPKGLYEPVLGRNVIVMSPRDEHYNWKAKDDLVFKRFKTYILEYIDSDSRLDSVELIYYLDIDIMVGATLGKLFDILEKKYDVLRSPENARVANIPSISRTFFFKGKTEKWPVQGGQFIIERRSSQTCLELWRNEIDGSVHKTTKDQYSVAALYKRIIDGKEKKCEIVLMDKKKLLVYPTLDKHLTGLVERNKYPYLIHLLNTLYAQKLDGKLQKTVIEHVLRLSEDEKALQLFGKDVIRAERKNG